VAAADTPESRFVIGSLTDAADDDAVARGLGGPKQRWSAFGRCRRWRPLLLGQIELFGFEFRFYHGLAHTVDFSFAAWSPLRDKQQSQDVISMGQGIPIGRMGAAQEYANLAYFLVSDAGSYVHRAAGLARFHTHTL
jgi:hypothetical protein